MSLAILESLPKPRLMALLDHLRTIEDPHDLCQVAFPLREVLLLVGSGTICGCEDYNLITAYGERHLGVLRRFLPYNHSVPRGRWLTILMNRMNRISPALFSAAFTNWARATWLDWPDVIAIDGKTSRRSHDRAEGRPPLHLVSAFATAARLVLSQEAVPDKAGETTAIPALIARLSERDGLKGALVAIDGIATNPVIAEAILADGADYLLEPCPTTLGRITSLGPCLDALPCAEPMSTSAGSALAVKINQPNLRSEVGGAVTGSDRVDRGPGLIDETSRVGSRSGWPWNHASHVTVTSGRACSVAWAVFLVGEIARIEKTLQRAEHYLIAPTDAPVSPSGRWRAALQSGCASRLRAGRASSCAGRPVGVRSPSRSTRQMPSSEWLYPHPPRSGPPPGDARLPLPRQPSSCVGPSCRVGNPSLQPLSESVSLFNLYPKLANQIRRKVLKSTKIIDDFRNIVLLLNLYSFYKNKSKN